MNLAECREEIDRIDRQILELYQKRMDVCVDVALDKIKTGKKILDADREKQKLDAISAMVEDDFKRHGAVELFTQIMASSRKFQYRIMEEHGVTGRLPFIGLDDLDIENATVVYQGTEGAYSEQAMHRYFGENVKSFHVGTFRDAMLTIAEGNADFGVLPIENSSAGIVSENYDLLLNFENYIVAEQIIDIDHCLLGLEGAKESDIKEVYSHEQALMQCSEYLDSLRGTARISFPNTALAAKKVVEDKDKSKAAIASRKAAETYGLKILKESINFSSRNSTRFIIVTNQKVYLKNAKKISICIELPHVSGALYQALSNFIYNDLNMNRIESRPIPDRPWEYRFFIDFDGNLSDGAVKNALTGIREQARNMKIFGNY
ncbi:MAG: prephenate dehydratase [Lachnospiraceae bacterium]|nr:prephenate dehydratase [Lachnospiraceae bacterium]